MNKRIFAAFLVLAMSILQSTARFPSPVIKLVAT